MLPSATEESPDWCPFGPPSLSFADQPAAFPQPLPPVALHLSKGGFYGFIHCRCCTFNPSPAERLGTGCSTAPPSRLRGAPVRALMHPPLSGLQPLPPSFALSHMPAPHMGQCCTLLPPSFAHACEGRIPRLGLFLRLFIDGCGIIGAIATPSLLMYTVCIPNHPTLFFDCILSLFPHN
jgi:hypothetical protein